jgi:hypothetical protein
MDSNVQTFYEFLTVIAVVAIAAWLISFGVRLSKKIDEKARNQDARSKDKPRLPPALK